MKVGRISLILLAGGFGLAAAASGWLWFDMAWSRTSTLTPQALERQGGAILGAPGAIPAASLDRAERLIRAELRLAPQSRSAWCRLAYTQYRKAGGRLDAATAESLRRSYAFGAFAPDVFLWRTEFVFSNWSAAPEDLRRDAVRELQTFYSIWDQRKKIEVMASRIQDPVGRLAIELIILRAPPIPRG